MAGVISIEGRKDLLRWVKDWCLQHGRAGNLAEAEALAEEARQIVGGGCSGSVALVRDRKGDLPRRKSALCMRSTGAFRQLSSTLGEVVVRRGTSASRLLSLCRLP